MADRLVPPDDLFFTTKPLGQGTGLGLSMIYGFAKQSGGQARIYSEVGQGTVVCLYLPRHHGEAETISGSPERASMAIAEAGDTVLVVDDEPTVRMLVADVLGDLGYTAARGGGRGGRTARAPVRHAHRSARHRNRPPGEHERAADGRRGEGASTGPQGAVHHKLRGERVINNGQLEPGMSVLTKHEWWIAV